MLDVERWELGVHVVLLTNPWPVRQSLSSPSFGLPGRNSSCVHPRAGCRAMRRPVVFRYPRVGRSVVGVAVRVAIPFVAAPVASAAHPSEPDLASLVLVSVDPVTAVAAVFAVPIACPQAFGAGYANLAVVAVSAVGRPSSGLVSYLADSVDSAAVVVAVSSVLRASSSRSHD